MQTEALLEQSQKLAAELQAQQKELQQTNEQLGQKAQQLAEQNAEVERKNQQIEQARRALEDKAEELALTSKYKSEFLANMSHELRTPLNSILILGQQLAENPEQNLTAKQVEFARTIHSAGTDLLNLITDILDLSKIESGTVTVEPAERLLQQPARHRGAAVPPRRRDARARLRGHARSASWAAASVTDQKRLQQVLKNLLSNAFKFTEHGGVRLKVSRGQAAAGRTEHPVLDQTPAGGGVRGVRHRHRHRARRSRRSSSRRSSRRTPARAASTAAPASAWPSAASCRTCSAARSSCGARRASGSTFTLYLPRHATSGRRSSVREPARSALGERAGVAASAVVRGRRTPEPVPDDRADLQPGDLDAADGGGRSALRARAGRSRPRPGLQGAGRLAGHRRAGAGARVPPDARSRSTCSSPTCSAGRCSAT